MEPRCTDRGGETVLNFIIYQIMEARDISVEKPEQNNPAAPQRDANLVTFHPQTSTFALNV